MRESIPVPSPSSELTLYKVQESGAPYPLYSAKCAEEEGGGLSLLPGDIRGTHLRSLPGL